MFVCEPSELRKSPSEVRNWSWPQSLILSVETAQYRELQVAEEAASALLREQTQRHLFDSSSPPKLAWRHLARNSTSLIQFDSCKVSFYSFLIKLPLESQSITGRQSEPRARYARRLESNLLAKMTRTSEPSFEPISAKWSENLPII